MAGASSSGSGSGHSSGSGDTELTRSLRDIADATKATAEAVKQLVTMGRFGSAAGGPGGGSSSTPRYETAYAKNERERRERFAEQQQATYARAHAYSQAGMGSVGSRMAGLTSQAQGLQSLGFGGTARMMQGAAGPLAFAGAGIEKANSVARVLHDSFSTGAQKLRTFASKIPGISTLMDVHDSFSGRQDAMARSHAYGQQERLEAHTNSRIATMQASHRIEQTTLGGTAAAYARGSAVVGRVFDRGTAGGEVAHQDEQRMLGYRKETAKAERDLATSTAHRVQANKELVGLQVKQTTLAKQIAKAEQIADKEGSGPSRDFALRLASAKRDEFAQNNEQLASMRRQSVDAGRGESQARAARDIAKVREDMLGRADILEAKAGRSQATAVRLGGMDHFERQRGLQAFKMLQGGANLDLMPQDLKAAAQSYAPQEFEKLVQKHGEGTQEFAEGKRMGLVGFEGKASDLQKESDTLRAGAGEKEYGIESRQAKEAVAIGREFGKDIGNDLRIALGEAKKEIINILKQGRP